LSKSIELLKAINYIRYHFREENSHAMNPESLKIQKIKFDIEILKKYCIVIHEAITNEN